MGSAFLDRCHVGTHPVVSFEKLGEFFAKELAEI